MYIFYEFHSVGVGFWYNFGLLRKKRASLYTHISILAKELRSGFAALFGIPVAFILVQFFSL